MLRDQWNTAPPGVKINACVLMNQTEHLPLDSPAATAERPKTHECYGCILTWQTRWGRKDDELAEYFVQNMHIDDLTELWRNREPLTAACEDYVILCSDNVEGRGLYVFAGGVGGGRRWANGGGSMSGGCRVDGEWPCDGKPPSSIVRTIGIIRESVCSRMCWSPTQLRLVPRFSALERPMRSMRTRMSRKPFQLCSSDLAETDCRLSPNPPASLESHGQDPVVFRQIAQADGGSDGDQTVHATASGFSAAAHDCCISD